MVEKAAQCFATKRTRLDFHLLESRLESVSDGVDRRAAERVMWMRLEQRAPGVIEQRARRTVSPDFRQRNPRLDVANECTLGHRIAPLLRRARPEGAL